MLRSPSRPDQRRRRHPAWAVLLLLVGVATFSGGCSDCDVDCGDSDDIYSFTGELRSVDGYIATFDGPEGTVRVQIYDRLQFLDIGERYRVPTHQTGALDADYGATINAACGCGGGVTHDDGQRVDTGYWRLIKESGAFRLAAGLFFGIPLVTLLGVTLFRFGRGRTHDPYAALPESGEWVEFDDSDEHADAAWDDFADDERAPDDELS